MKDEERNEQQPEAVRATYLPVGIGIGLAIGAGLGAATGHIAIGVGLGMSMGVAAGIILDWKRESQNPSKQH